MVLHSWVEWLKDQEHLWKAPSAEREVEAGTEGEEQQVSHRLEAEGAAPPAWPGALDGEAAAEVAPTAALQASIVHGEPFVERKSAFQVPTCARFLEPLGVLCDSKATKV